MNIRINLLKVNTCYLKLLRMFIEEIKCVCNFECINLRLIQKYDNFYLIVLKITNAVIVYTLINPHCL